MEMGFIKHGLVFTSDFIIPDERLSEIKRFPEVESVSRVGENPCSISVFPYNIEKDADKIEVSIFELSNGKIRPAYSP